LAQAAEQGQRDPAAPDPSLCLDQLRRILSSPAFEATDRDRRFLSYVVEEALAGRANRIKAYAIALEVFGREASFDPQTDPIVRVEAGHLRRALDRYYLAAGRTDPIVIAIPKGGYAPTFTDLRPEVDPNPPPVRRPGWSSALAAAAAAFALGAGGAVALGMLIGQEPVPPDAGPGVPRLAIEPFDAVAGGSASAIASALGTEVVTEVARFKDIVIVTRTADDDGDRPPPQYQLGGSVAVEDEQLRVQVRLERRWDGAVVWADRYVAALSDEPLFALESRIAGQIATTVGQPYGAIFQAIASERGAGPSPSGDPYACTLSYFSYRATLEPASYARARECLEDAVVSFPNYGTAWALLGQVHLDGRRWGFASDRSLDDALGEARRALMLDPLNVRALQVKMLALHLSGDIAGALRTGEAALAINPNDTELTGEYGFRLALAGRWDEGCALLQQAIDRNPGPLPYYETGLALCAYIAGDYAAAAARIKATPVPAIPIYHLMAAAFLAEAGDAEAARREHDWLEAQAPELVRTLLAQVTPLVGRPEDLTRFAASLAKAGIRSPSRDFAEVPDPAQ
jgi:TolB-like protein/Tfp pilus assembly protein PilF